MSESEEVPQNQNMDATATIETIAEERTTTPPSASLTIKMMTTLLLWIVPTALAFGLLSPIIFLIVAMLLWLQASDVATLVAGGLLLFATAILGRRYILPWVAVGLSKRVRSAFSHEWMYPESIDESQQATRRLLIALSATQFLCAFISATTFRTLNPMTIFGFASPEAPTAMIVLKNGLSFGLLILGLLLLASGTRIFLGTLGRSIKKDIGGDASRVQLMDFIAEWDNPGRRIFTTCRYSRRIGYAHRSILWATASCFTLAGITAVTLSDDYWIGELLTLNSIVCTLALWPTPPRLVRWTTSILKTVGVDD